MEKKPFDPNQELDLPPILDIDLSDDIDQPHPEPIVTAKAEEKLPKKSHKLLFIIIAVSSSLFIISGVLIWLFMLNGIYTFQGLPLRNFSNDIYSIQIPKGYTANENDLGDSGSDATFIDPYEKIEGTQSKVYVVIGKMDSAAKQKYINDLDSLYSAANIEKSKKGSGYVGMANIDYSKANLNGMQARTVVYDATKGNDHICKYYKVSIFNDGKLYEIIISAPNGNPGLAVDANKIIDSFTVK